MDTTEDWVISTDHPGYKVKTIKKGMCTFEVYRPILTDEERKKIEEHVKRTAESVLRSYYKRKELEKHEQQNHN